MRLLTVDQAGQVMVWKREETGFVAGPYIRHEGARWCAFLQHGYWVSGSDETLQVFNPTVTIAPLVLSYGWKVESPESRRFALSRDAGRVAVASYDQAVSWDLGSSDPAATRLDLPRHEGYIQCITASDDGTRLATAMINGPVRLWEMSSLANVVSLPEATRDIMLLAFLDHDRKLLTGHQDRSLAVWDLDPASLMERARRLAGRELTEDEKTRFLEL